MRSTKLAMLLQQSHGVDKIPTIILVGATMLEVDMALHMWPNVIFVSPSVHVLPGPALDLSAVGEAPPSASGRANPGQAGAHGTPGLPGGNLVVICHHLIDGEMTLSNTKSNGQYGGSGQDGGNGVGGRDAENPTIGWDTFQSSSKPISMETVAVEWVASTAVTPPAMAMFVQQLKDIPQDALCEVGDIFCRRLFSGRQRNQNERQVRSEVHLSCESSVATFLCHKFRKPTRHVTNGEIICVRCKRVYPGVKPLGKVTVASRRFERSDTFASRDDTDSDSGSESYGNACAQMMPPVASQVAVLPIDKVIALIDLLGNQVVDAQDAYEYFAEPDANAPRRMTLIGLTKALTKLCENKWTVKPGPHSAFTSKPTKYEEDAAEHSSSARNMVEKIRYLLSKLIASDGVALRRVPTATTVPFISYTDFLACYVAFLADQHE